MAINKWHQTQQASPWVMMSSKNTRVCASSDTNFSNFGVWPTTITGGETCRGVVDEMNALVDDVSRTVAQNAENVRHCGLHRQSAHAQTVSRCAACDKLLRNQYSRRHWRRKLRQQWRHLRWRHILAVCRRCSWVQTSIEHLYIAWVESAARTKLGPNVNKP